MKDATTPTTINLGPLLGARVEPKPGCPSLAAGHYIVRGAAWEPREGYRPALMLILEAPGGLLLHELRDLALVH